MITQVNYITAGLKLSYYRKDEVRINASMRHLCLLNTLAVFIFVLTAVVEILSVMGKYGFNEKSILVYMTCVAPLLAIYYIVDLFLLFKYMNTEQNPALQPEHKKMAW